MIKTHQKHANWLAFMLHRVSGLILAVFLPVHFYVLGMALNDPATLDGFLHWAELPAVKFAETGLVFLLAIHFFGGLRIMALEFLPWSPQQKTWVSFSIAGAFFVACAFLLRAF